MFIVGECSIKAKKLIKVTYDSMMKAIKPIKANTKIGNIVHAAVRSFYVPTSGTVPTSYSMTLPFTAKNTGGIAGRGTGQEISQTGVSLFVAVTGNGTTAVIKGTNGGAPPANSYLDFAFTYEAA